MTVQRVSRVFLGQDLDNTVLRQAACQKIFLLEISQDYVELFALGDLEDPGFDFVRYKALVQSLSKIL